MLPASGTGLVVGELGGTLFWAVTWLLLHLGAAGLLALVGFSLISRLLPLLWLVAGLLRLPSQLGFLLSGLRLRPRR